MTRHIVHLDIPNFYAVLEELRRPELKKRSMVLAEPSARAIVQGINSNAGKEGIREGMPLAHARRMCRRVLAVAPDLRFYREEHQQILKEFGFFSPLVEGAWPGHYFVDLTGTQRLLGPGPDVACRMERHLATQRRLRARIGLAANKLVSQVASTCIVPGDLNCIFPGGETSFLAPLPVTSLPGVGAVTASRLADFNIRRIGQLAALSLEALCGVFGKMGSRLFNVARGIDPTPVLPSRESPRLVVAHSLERDEIDRDRLEALLFQQVEEAGWALRSHNRHPTRFVLEIRYADGITARSAHALFSPAIHADRRLFRVILPVFRQLFNRRIALRRIVLELSDFAMPFRQASLFSREDSPPSGERDLQQALDGIRGRFGNRAISWGNAMSGAQRQA
ncbi:Y-family DNA polymerase [Syntrophobacter fumaroxidans]|uniref:DNA-directed DNA polymerase n=1 Tax=Syntrophobacter fumaroxidans (strain DSM 10017 / MPOB) TaxID=335543 RepID=A0LGS2_SYNFM|nr:DNA-directed DNA polymerase [Syntrophobacter fumaroxidans]ABK16624.1 DNA-directed DNA polymerase [Syntrophobacter fumaroxidans MPOB]